jgi:ferric-dicitrate binding protein FerR (iron transport regulator)
MVKNDINMTWLSRYYSGDLNMEERREIDAWIMESDENRSLAKEVCHLLYTSDTLDIIQKTDARPALRKITKRIEIKRRRRNIETGIYRITAICFLPLLIGTLLYLMPETEGTVRYMTARASTGAVSFLELPDGSEVWLNSGSYVRYPVVFSGEKREVYFSGEAYFSVAKDAKRKFIVQTPRQLSLEVTGTEFNIDAYETNDFVKTTLVEGTISLICLDGTGEYRKYPMKPEQQITYLPQTREARLQKTYIQKDIAWKNGRVIFRDTPFEEALWILSKRFNVSFKVRKEALYKNSFTGTFTDQDLTRILEHFKLSSGIRYSQKQLINDDGEIQKTEIEMY